MSDQSGLAATSGTGKQVDPGAIGDWADWLRRADGHPADRQPSLAADAEIVWTTLTHLARRRGFTVNRAACADADGFTTWRNRMIRISPDAAPAQAVIALAHQLGHVLLHSHIAQLEQSGSVPCTGIRKVEADSVAYLIADRIGLNAEAMTFLHVSSWAGTDPRANPGATIQAVTSRILATADAITSHLQSAGVVPQPVALTRARPWTTEQRSGPVPPVSELIRVHETAAQFFRSQMPGSWAPDYLARRGLGPAVQDRWLAGYAPAAWDTLTRHLRDTGFSDAVIEASGLARQSRRGTLIDTFRDRVMFPIRSPDGTTIAFIGRAAEDANPEVPKYLNSPSTALYDKGQVLFGLCEARDALANGARPVLVEGPLDTIAVTTSGLGKLVGVAPCGTAFSDRHAIGLSQAADLPSAGITVAFDSDKAGRRAAVRTYHELVPLTERLAAAALPPGRDPAQILAESGPDDLATMLTKHRRPLADLVINTEVAKWGRWLRYPEGQIRALRAAAPLIAAMPPAHVARQVTRLAAILKLDHATVTQAVTDALTEAAAHTRHEQTDSRTGIAGPPGRAAGDDIPHDTKLPVARTTGAPSPARRKHRDSDQARLAQRRIRR